MNMEARWGFFSRSRKSNGSSDWPKPVVNDGRLFAAEGVRGIWGLVIIYCPRKHGAWLAKFELAFVEKTDAFS